MAAMIVITALVHLWHAMRPPSADDGGPRD